MYQQPRNIYAYCIAPFAKPNEKKKWIGMRKLPWLRLRSPAMGKMETRPITK